MIQMPSALPHKKVNSAGYDAVARLGRAHMDADPVGVLPTTVFTPRSRQPSAAAMAQTGHELLAQFSSRLGVHGRANRSSGALFDSLARTASSQS